MLERLTEIKQIKNCYTQGMCRQEQATAQGEYVWQSEAGKALLILKNRSLLDHSYLRKGETKG